MKTELMETHMVYVVWMDGREMYHNKNYRQARAYAWDLIKQHQGEEVIVTLCGLLVGI